MNRRSFLRLLGAALIAPEVEKVGELFLPRKIIVQVPASYSVTRTLSDAFDQIKARADRPDILLMSPTLYEQLKEIYSTEIVDLVCADNPFLRLMEEGGL